MNPVGNSIAVDAEATTPVGNGVRFAIKRYLSDSRLVVVLLNPSRPLAVARLIVAVSVDALNGVLGRWAWPHVGNKVGKRIEPTVANVNATASVARMGTDAATLTHGSPNTPFWGVRHAVLKMKRTGFVSLKASAAFGVSAIELVGWYVEHFAALALANPFANVATARKGTLDSSQASEFHSSQINFGRHSQTV